MNKFFATLIVAHISALSFAKIGESKTDFEARYGQPTASQTVDGLGTNHMYQKDGEQVVVY